MRKLIASGFIVVAGLNIGVGLLTPSTAYAEEGLAAPPAGVDVGILVSKPGDIAQGVVDFIFNGFVTAGRLGLKNALRSFLEKLAYDTAVWLGSGGEGQTPLIFTKDAGTYLLEARDAASGEFLNTLATENGFLEFNLCELSSAQSLQFQVFIPRILAIQPYKPKCTLSNIGKNFEALGLNVREQAAAMMDDPSALIKISRSYEPGENPLSSIMSAMDTAIATQTNEADKAVIERKKSDYRDQTAPVSGFIQTPAATVDAQVRTTINQSSEGELNQMGNIVADAVSVFFNTLAAKLTDKLASGFLSFFTEADINESLSGSSSLVGGASGLSGTQAQFANIKTPAFTSGGSVDILNEFASCPTGNQGLDVTNCVLNEGMRSAIEEKLTLRQAIDSGRIDGSWIFGTLIDADNPSQTIHDSIPLRNIKILKQYSVVPVGWVLAGEYNYDFDATSYSLQQIMDSYGNCSAENYSPYCGLVDPDWVLVAPQVFCNVEAFNEVQATPNEFLDLDGSSYTPKERLVSRLNTCVDFQTCLTEADNGQCEGGQYGYCTEQRDIYRFEGEQCPAHFASCEQFTDNEGNNIGYLKNTLNYNDCSADNAGCQWDCAFYNEVDEDFVCAAQDQLWLACTAAAGCSCTVTAESCDIPEGGTRCETETEGTCRLISYSETVFGDDAAITFDGDVRTCTSDNAGCTQVTSIKGDGANLLFNSSFEQFNSYKEVTPDALLDLADITDTPATSSYLTDTFGFYGELGDNTGTPATYGAPCVYSAFTLTLDAPCYGWARGFNSGARVVDLALDGSVGLQLQDVNVLGGGGAYIEAYVDVGRPIANRSFALNYAYHNTGTTGPICEGLVRMLPAPQASGGTWQVVYADSVGFVNADELVYTFDDNVANQLATGLTVEIYNADGCDIVLDQVKLEELSPEIGISSSSGFENYGDSTYGLNIVNAASCTQEEVGCQLYTPETGESDLAIPGQITNPLSNVCTGPAGLTNPSCSQCLEEFVGCEAYFETPAVNQAPIKDGAGFGADFLVPSFDTALAAGIAKRTGYFCVGTDTSCSPTRAGLDCGTVACEPAVSIVPSTGETCSAASVGCEEYINLDEQTAGGEGVKNYTYIRQCVSETFTSQSPNDLDTYFTFEGSDQTGYQIRSWFLKKSDTNGAPCTNLDLYGPTAQTPEAACADALFTQQTCSVLDVGVNPDCVEYFNSTGDVYYMLQSQTITVSDSCEALRNTLDGRLYHAIPAESTSCPASENLCREYQGSEAGSALTIVDEKFDIEAWAGGETSATVVTANAGLSMALGDGTLNNSSFASTPITSSMQVGKTYVTKFWAKTTDPGTTVQAVIYTPSTANTILFDVAGVILNSEWRQYTIGPFVYEGPLSGDEEFGLQYNTVPGSIAYFDNVELTRSENQYLIADSSDGCFGYEGCEQYRDPIQNTQYLKSFSNLCSEEVLGCEVVIDTHNNDSPYYEHYNTSNNDRPEGGLDDVIVRTDEMATYAVVPNVLCDESIAGCGIFGTPSFNTNDEITGFTEQYLVNDPDDYDTSLCQEQSRSCDVFGASDGTQFFFKNPGVKTCSYNASGGQWEMPNGDPCPTQNNNVSPSQPLGPVCNGGIRVDQICSTDADCPSATTDTNIYACDSQVNVDSGWAGTCQESFAGCTAYIDPNTENLVINGDFETNIRDNHDVLSPTADAVPDAWIDFGNPLDIDPAEAPIGYESAMGFVAIPCDDAANGGFFDQVQDPVFEGDNALRVSAAWPLYRSCIVGPQDDIEVDPNKYYTLSADVWTDSIDDTFAIGLYYFEEDGTEITQHPNTDPLTAEEYAIAAWEGTGRGSTDGLVGRWNKWHATIGPNLEVQFPQNTGRVRVFLEAGKQGGGVKVDNVKFTENVDYTYINNSIDGVPESDTNTCAGTVDAGEGCVPFHDVTNTTLTGMSDIEDHLLNDPSFPVQSCEFDAIDDSGACRSTANTADTNRVIKVRRDRECAAWLSCTTGVPNDGNGDGVFDDITCLNVGICTDRNPDTGVCTSWAEQKNVNALGAEDDQTIEHVPDDPNGPLSVANASGYVSVGGTWVGICRPVDSALKCIGGLNSGQGCSTDTDCSDAYITFGHYPYSWATQRGLASALSTIEIVTDSTFEEVYCDVETYGNALANDYGTVTSDTQFTVDIDGDGDVDIPKSLERARDRSQECTIDRHCRTIQTESQLETIANETDASGAPLYPALSNVDDLSSVFYERGWCDNVNETTETWRDWRVEDDATMEVVDYEDGFEYATAEYQLQQFDPSGGSISALALQLNNAMHIIPDNGAQAGASVFLDDKIVQGGEYTLSFDAAYTRPPDNFRDVIRIGLQHGSDPENTDYFAGGQAMADIIFVVDASNSMSTEIANVAAAASDLVGGLDDNGVDYQIGIVTTSETAGPYVLDFFDYQPVQPNYGGSNGINIPMTDNVTMFTDAMTWISNNLQPGGQEHNYEALVDISDNEFATNPGFEYPFRDEASKFVILVTDEAPDGSDPNIAGSNWAESDENTMITGGLPPNPFNLYTIALPAGNAHDAYDDLSGHLGGDIYNINLTDYSPTLNDIAIQIVRNTLDFRFNQNFERYTLGPIEIEQYIDNDFTTDLFFVQGSGSTDTPFVIDNVSLKPSLEVSKENNKHSTVSTNLISRDCRAYPQNSSRYCSYTEEGGTIYTGWKGYCLERDGLDTDRCVAWWPVDVIAGEPGLFPDAIPVLYEGLIPTYHCIVAKGNQNLGMCMGEANESGSLALCTDSGQCDSGERCLGRESNDNQNDYLQDSPKAWADCSVCGDGTTTWGCNASSTLQCDNMNNIHPIFGVFKPMDEYEMRHIINSGGAGAVNPPGPYRIKHTIEEIPIDPSSHANFQAEVTWQGFDHEWGTFLKITPSALEQSIHISEIDAINFDMGTPVFDTVSWWPVSNLPAAGAGLFWTAGKSTFSTRTDFPGGVYTSYGADVTNTPAGFTDPTPFQSDAENMQSWAWNSGIWCETPDTTDPLIPGPPGNSSPSGLCDGDSTKEEIENSDYYIAKQIGTKEAQTTTNGAIAVATPFNLFYDTGLVSDPLNSVLGEDSDIWNTVGSLTNPGSLSLAFKYETSEGDIFTIDDSFQPFRTWWNDGNEPCYNATSNCGQNTMLVMFDFKDGYLADVYLVFVDGFHRADVSYMEDVSWTFELREPCLLVAEGASIQDNQVIAHAWQTRVSQGSGYAAFEVGYTFNTFGDPVTVPAGFGAIGLDSNNGEPHELDGLPFEIGTEHFEFSAIANDNLPFAYVSTLPSNTGIESVAAPFACIGDCSLVCDEDHDLTGPLTGACAFNRWVGMAGKCVYDSSAPVELIGEIALNDDDESQVCNVDVDCALANTYCDESASEAAGTNPDNYDPDGVYEEQLKKAAGVGWERYRQLFVDVERLWYAPKEYVNNPSIPRHGGKLMSVSDALASDGYRNLFFVPTQGDVLGASDFLDADGASGTYDYDEMSQCNNLERNNGDYCYYQPLVENITIDGNQLGTVEIDSGTAIVLQFSSDADADQEPLQTITLDWRGSTGPEDFDVGNDAEGPLQWGGASTPGHIFTHVYTCNFPSDAIFYNNGACEYRMRIQVMDAWGVCSGSVSGDGIDNDGDGFIDNNRSNANEGGCTSYDEYEGLIRVLP